MGKHRGLLLFCCAIPLLAQQARIKPSPPDPIFQVGTSLLQVEVQVTDRRGRDVERLTRDDFIVAENGSRQDIVTFEYVPRMVTTRSGRGSTLPPSPKADTTPEDPVSRTWLLVLTDVPPQDLTLARKAIRKFLDNEIQPGLSVSLNGLSFTEDKPTLLRQLEQQAWEKDALGSANGSGLDAALLEAGFGQVLDYDANLIEDQHGRTRLFRYLNLMSALARYPGRKIVVLFSRGFPIGFDYETNQFVNLEDVDLLDHLRGEATRSRIRFYTVQVQGLTALNEKSEASAVAAPESGLSVVADKGLSVSMGDASRNLQSGLRVIAAETGGKAVMNTNDLGEVFDAVLEGLGGYYLLGYHAPEAAQEDVPREIRVEVSRNDVKLDYQRLYYDQASFQRLLRGVQESRVTEVVGESPSGTTQEAPPAALAHYQSAFESLRSQPSDLDAPVGDLEAATALYPRFAMAWTLLGYLRSAQGDTSAVRRAFAKAVEADPNYISPYSHLLRLDVRSQDWEAARTTALQLLEHKPDEDETLYYLALSEYNTRRIEDAEARARALIERGAEEKYPQVQQVMGLTLAAKGDLPGAVVAYEAYLRLNPASPQAEEVRARLAEWKANIELSAVQQLTAEGRWPRVAERSSALLAADDNLTAAHFLYGLAQFNLGALDLAAQHARRVQQQPDADRFPESHYLLGLVEAQRGNIDVAIEEYRAFLAAQPDTPLADGIRDQISEWESVERRRAAVVDSRSSPLLDLGPSAQTDLPDHVIALARIKYRMRLSLEHIPNYTCRQTIERARLTKAAVRRLERKLKQRGQSRIDVDVPLESSDTVQVELAYVDGQELYSWPGAEAFEEKTLGEMVGFGNLSAGLFASTAHNLFHTNAARFEFVGREDHVRPLLRFDFHVGLFQSGFILSDPAGREAEVPYAGSIWADPETFDLVRIETRALEIPEYLEIAETISRIDYQRVELDGDGFLIPKTADEVTRLQSGAENRNRTEFSGCRRFGASSDISFDAEGPREDADERSAWEEFDLPEGVSMSIHLQSVIDSRESKIGDAVKGVFENEIRHGGSLVAPKGAEVLGRIRRLGRYTDPGPYYTLGIEISELRFKGKRARFTGRMTKILPVPGLVFGGPARLGNSAYEVVSSGRVPHRIKRDRIETYEDFTLPGVGVFSIQGGGFHIPPRLRMMWETVAEPARSQPR